MVIRSLGYAFKKKTLVATERHKPRVKALRLEWMKYRQSRMDPDRVVFIDETAVKTHPFQVEGPLPQRDTRGGGGMDGKALTT